MEKTPTTFWDQLGNLLVPRRQVTTPRTVSNEQILQELIRCFDTSLNRESIGTSLLFDAHYVIILHPSSYAERLAALPVIVNEAVTAFNERLKQRNHEPNRIVTVASHWHFKFGPGTEFDGKPISPADVEVIGSLTGASLENDSVSSPKAGSVNLKATRKVKNTNVYEKLDLNLPAFSQIDFRESGAFAVRIDPAILAPPVADATPAEPVAQPAVAAPPAQPAPSPIRPDALARIDCYMADQNVEETYWMKDREIVIARREPDNELFPNYIRLTSPYVSNPHARIRHDAASGQFQLASFSRHETRLNEQVVERSEPGNPNWVELPGSSQILLNGVVTLTFQSNL
ncbi:FHA domain-containing protein [uncultured Fibrella sp.]|uniref:FHA domain-containing protein n=1 Tax=uncultured Fibrella sp. TaxID=1284596 RepID=UPI0035C9C334